MTQLSRSALSASFNTNLPDNNSGLITPELLRTELVNTIDSVVFNNGDNPTHTGSNSISGSQDITGSQDISGSLGVSGSIRGSGSLNIIGPAIISGSTSITGSTSLVGSTTVIGSLDAANATIGLQNSTLSGSINATGSLTISGSLLVSGSGTFDNIGPFNQTGLATFTGQFPTSTTILNTGNLINSGGIIATATAGNKGYIQGGTGSFTVLQGFTDSNSIFFPDTALLTVMSPVLFEQAVTASANISSSATVIAATGSFGVLTGLSPITIVDQTEFLEPVTASIVSASGEITSAGFNTHVTPIASVDAIAFIANGRKVEVKNQLQGSLADGAFAEFELLNTSITTSSIVLGAFVGNTAGPITGSIITVAATASGGGAVQFHNETGQTIADDTAWTASFIVL